jgi:hypothetical protein
MLSIIVIALLIAVDMWRSKNKTKQASVPSPN